MIKKNVKKLLASNNGPSIFAWSVFALVLLFFVASYYYGDTVSIIRYEIRFMENLMDGGKLSEYYDFVMRACEGYGPVTGGNYATYDFPMYIILGIWGIPLYFLTAARGIDPSSNFFYILYGKGIFVVALLVGIILVYKIAKSMDMGDERAKWAAFFYATSAFSYVTVGINGQTDVIGVVFILCGFYFYVSDMSERGYWKFLIAFMIATPFKMFATFIFVALLLLRKKAPVDIAIGLIVSYALKLVLSLFFYPSSPAIAIKKDFEKVMFERLTANRIPLGNGNVAVIVLGLGIVYALCYLHKPITDIVEYRKASLFAVLSSLVVVFTCFESSSYWFLHLAPYLALMIAYNTASYWKNILFEVAAIGCHLLSDYGSRAWAYDIHHCKGMLLNLIINKPFDSITPSLNLEEFCILTHITKLNSAVQAMFIVFLYSMLWINRPSQIEFDDSIKLSNGAYFRMFVYIAALSILPLLFIYNMIQG